MRIRSIIGRFLEHSRVFHFAAAVEDPTQGDFFIGSADWMYRNLPKRVEVVTPVVAKEAKEKLWKVLDICLRDRRQVWVAGKNGTHVRLEPGEATQGPEAIGTQATLRIWLAADPNRTTKHLQILSVGRALALLRNH